MRRLALMILATTLALGMMSATAQDPPPDAPRYSVYVGGQNGEIRILSHYGQDIWREQALPARPLFGQIRGQIALPIWSQDGAWLFMTEYAPLRADLAFDVSAFNVIDERMVAIREQFPPPQPEDPARLMRVQAISPDLRFGWLKDIDTLQNQLIDLTDGTTIIDFDDCPARVLAWLPQDRALMACTGELFSAPEIFVMELATGSRRIALPPPPDDAANPVARYVTSARLLDDTRLLVGPLDGGPPQYLGLLDLADGRASYFGVVERLRLSDDQQEIAYLRDGRLQRLNLTTLREIDLGPAAAFRWQGETLVYWQARQTDDNLQLIRVETTLTSRVERRLYDGLVPNRFTISPAADGYALEFQPGTNQSYVEVYNAEGLLWVSDLAFSSSYAIFQAPIDEPIYWSADGEWLHLNFLPNLAEPQRTLSVNVTDGETVLAEAGALFVTESPDGAWWFYTLATNLERPDIRQSLVGFQVATGGRIQSNLSAPIYEDFQFPLRQFIRWSPVQPANE